MSAIFEMLKTLDNRSKELLLEIQLSGPITNNQLMLNTNMAKSTLNRTMEPLINNKLIVEESTGDSTGGRKPIMFDVNNSEFYMVGVDISRTYIQMVLVNMKMDMFKEQIFYGVFTEYEIIEIIQHNVTMFIKDFGLNSHSILGIGIGVVGTIKMPIANGEISNGNEFLKDTLEKSLGYTVFIDNGANAAVTAEYYFGYGKGKKNISYINCGVGIRTGVISDGRLIRSINNKEDAFGHMTVDIDGVLCSCGNFGCVESYASITRITDKFISEVKKGYKTNSERNLEDIDYIYVCSLAEANDEIAKKVIIEAALHFGTGLSNYIKLLNPEMVILSGPLVNHSLLFYERCIETVLKKCSVYTASNIEFRREGYYGGRSISVGAAYMAFKESLK